MQIPPANSSPAMVSDPDPYHWYRDPQHRNHSTILVILSNVLLGSKLDKQKFSVNYALKIVRMRNHLIFRIC